MKLPLALASLLFFGACGGQMWSEDPKIAATQQWALSCQVTDSNIRTMATLRKAGQLSESVVNSMEEVVVLYAVICLGDPPDADGSLASQAVKIIAARVCPSLVPSDSDNWALTAAEAASCAAEAALLAETS